MAVDEAKHTIERFKNENINEYNSKHEEFFDLAAELDSEDFDPDDDGQIRDVFMYHGVETEYIADFKEWFAAQQKIAAYLASMGAKYLDDYMPDWRDRVNEEYLSMASGQSCILGQVFGDYEAGINQIYRAREEGAEYIPITDFSKEHGFIDNGACYLALDYAWQDELRRRR